jgi:hypothetical protein
MFMSFRNRLALPVILFSLAVLAGCGSGSSSTITPIPPPSGGFSNSNLNGTYVFSVSGTDNANGAPYAIVGAFTANGSGGNGQGGITGGTIDFYDPAVANPVANAAINSSAYSVGVDGRGKANLSTALPAPFNAIVLDFVLQDGSHGAVTEFDTSGSGSGSLDLQAAGVQPAGSYAFIFGGADVSTGTGFPFATVGNFTLGAGGAISSGLQDFNDNQLAYANEAVSGQVVLGPSSTPATTLVTTTFAKQTFDVYAIDATHLKFIEMDGAATLSGDAYSQASTAVPTGNMAFTLAGSYPGPTSSSAAGGFIVTDGSGNITAASTMDANDGGTVTANPLSFTGTYTAAGTGRFTLGLTGVVAVAGSSYSAYPSSGGLLLLEIDDSGIMSGVAYPPQTSNTFNGSAGYGLNLAGINLVNMVEVDNIAEFTSNTSGTTVTGAIDENFAPGGGPNYGLALSGNYTATDANGRGQISANAGNSSNSTLNGGFGITFYAVDGTTFPFIETDPNGQVGAGVFFLQNATSASAGTARPHMLVPSPPVRPRAARSKKK